MCIPIQNSIESPDNSVGIWRAVSWTASVEFPAGARDSSVLHSVQTSFGAQPVSSIGVESYFPWGLNVRGQERWSYASSRPYMAWCLIKHRDNLTFTSPKRRCREFCSFLILSLSPGNREASQNVKLDSELIRKCCHPYDEPFLEKYVKVLLYVKQVYQRS
jgi:hypothetical protein